mmetsp:Transcript_87118/g.232239  ORF Transcript_87118/g.232239 Transcript_87118/m.232239 type:complete len:155 (-) Transcript_87118:160-624(-)
MVSVCSMSEASHLCKGSIANLLNADEPDHSSENKDPTKFNVSDIIDIQRLCAENCFAGSMPPVSVLSAKISSSKSGCEDFLQNFHESKQMEKQLQLERRREQNREAQRRFRQRAKAEAAAINSSLKFTNDQRKSSQRDDDELSTCSSHQVLSSP